MAQRPKYRVGSTTTRLFALLLLPLLAMSYLGLGTINRKQADADAARHAARFSELRSDVASITNPAQLEQLALEGLSRLDAFDVPRELVSDLAGLDLEQIYGDNIADFDAALDSLVANHGDVVLSSGETLGVRLSFVRGQLETQRSFSNEGRAERSDIRSVFVALDEALEAALTVSRPADTGSVAASSAQAQSSLVALRNVQLAAGSRGRALLDDLTTIDNNSTLQIVIASARLDSAIANYVDLLDADDAADFGVVSESLTPVPDELLLIAGADDEFDYEYIDVAATTFLEHLTYLDVLDEYSRDTHMDVASQLDRQASAAESVVSRTQMLIAGLLIATSLLGFLIAASTLRPLRRLRRRASQVGLGELNLAPLPVRGPSDVRLLTASVNDMLATLQAVDEQVRSLSADEPSTTAAAEIPGNIGVSIRQSLDHLDHVTTQLRTSEELSSAIVEQAVDGIWTIDASGVITSANEASEHILDTPADRQIGRAISDFLPALEGEAVVQLGDDAQRHYLVASSAIDSGEEPLTAVIARDVSEHLRFEERLAYQAHHDALTGLPNRFALLEHITNLDADEPVAILFLDLDGFKTVNDVQGHVAGDAVLEEIAQRLVRAIRPHDFVGRIGGDEFVVAMRQFDGLDDVVSFGRRLIREIELPYENGSKAFTISASIGVAVHTDGLGSDLQALDAIQQADSAVYLAKRRGRGRVEIFDNELQDAIIRDADLELALRSAAPNDELELHLQPIMNLTTGEFKSAEALVRWNRPGIGLVPPGDFIPVAERSGLIYEIEQWVLHEACSTLARWRKLDPFCMTKIAVNVSGRHLLEGDLLVDLRGALRATGADPHLLEIELTETQLLDDLDRATTILDAVRSQGIAVAIDDFGTGYSSMAYLHQLPIDTLKIDREFVSVINDKNSDSSVLDALLTIATALDVSVIAEGIEDIAQLEHLRERGCERGQGFLLAQPVPISQAEAIVGIGLASRHEFNMATMEKLSRTVSAL